MTPARKWLFAIGGLLGANVVASVVLATTAAHGSSEVIPDYYERAAHYDDAIDQGAANQKLGWRVDVAAAAGAIDIRVRDAAGAPLDGAAIELSGYQRAHASQPFHGTGAHVPVGVHGVCDVAITVTRGAARFVAQRTIEVP